MEPCDCDKDLLVAYALGELGEDEAKAARDFLSRCPVCREDLSLHQSVAEDLTSRPSPTMPSDLREVLIRSAVQSRRDWGPAWARPRSGARPRIRWTPVLCAGAGLAIVGMLVFFVVPGAGPGGSVDEVVSGGVGRGATALEEIMELVANLQSGWVLARSFLERFSPLTRGIQTAFGAVGVLSWAVASLSVLGVIGLLWRLNRGNQRRSVEHA